MIIKHKSTYFYYFLLFNLCFFILQASLLYSQNSSFVSTIKLPDIAWLQIGATLLVHITLYLFLSLFQTLLLVGILKRSWHYFTADQWQIIIWTLCSIVIISANAYYFPLSLFSKLFSPPIPNLLITSLLCISSFLLSLLLLNNLFYRSTLYFLAVTIPMILWNQSHQNQPLSQSNLKPNVIILGIDSLSPESINSQNMPFFSQLLRKSTQFTQAISPLARTYPAWSSILTGLYAKHHHAQENLVAKNTVESHSSITWLLKNQGYQTIFATDDRRFNGIGEEFGFNKIIGPKLGVNDILLGSFNDFPLSNLLINFKINSWLFPYNYSNRASFFSYYPQTFDTQLRNEFAAKTPQTPIFLAVHFTLPHWPYAWAESLPEQVNNEFSLEKRNVLYQQALKRTDKQLHSFFDYLKKQNYFKNTLLILLSDHGEALYYPNSRLTTRLNYQGTFPSQFATYLKEKTATVLNKSAGHGSDILSPRQYHSVLAFRIYQQGKKITKNAQIKTRVALIDLAPTILNFLHLKPVKKMDGLTLLQTILNPAILPLPRLFFIESGMFPNQLLSKQKSIEFGEFFYQVNPINGELEIKADKMNSLAEQKLYGIISDDWVLALYPNKTNYIPVIQNLSSGLWSDNLKSDFAQTTPAIEMYQHMQKFYGKALFLPLP